MSRDAQIEKATKAASEAYKDPRNKKDFATIMKIGMKTLGNLPSGEYGAIYRAVAKNLSARSHASSAAQRQKEDETQKQKELQPTLF